MKIDFAKKIISVQSTGKPMDSTSKHKPRKDKQKCRKIFSQPVEDTAINELLTGVDGIDHDVMITAAVDAASSTLDRVNAEFSLFAPLFFRDCLGEMSGAHLGFAVGDDVVTQSVRYEGASGFLSKFPNLLGMHFWFFDALLDGKGFTRRNFLQTQSIVIDVSFDLNMPSEIDSALARLDALPAKASIIWTSDNRLVAMYLLSDVIKFDVHSVVRRYNNLKKRICRSAKFFVAQKHLFRLPGSGNGKMLRWDMSALYQMDDLAGLFARYENKSSK